MFDLIIRGDRVVTPHGMGAWDVAVKGDKIAALTAPNTLDDDAAKRVIDATGKIVILSRNVKKNAAKGFLG